MFSQLWGTFKRRVFFLSPSSLSLLPSATPGLMPLQALNRTALDRLTRTERNWRHSFLGSARARTGPRQINAIRLNIRCLGGSIISQLPSLRVYMDCTLTVPVARNTEHNLCVIQTKENPLFFCTIRRMKRKEGHGVRWWAELLRAQMIVHHTFGHTFSERIRCDNGLHCCTRTTPLLCFSVIAWQKMSL